MARKTEDIEAGSLKIRITQMGAGDAPSALARSVRLFGAALAQPDHTAKVVALFASFNDADFASLRAKFIENAQQIHDIETSAGAVTERLVPLRLDAFDGDLQAQFSFMLESVRVNFQDFFVAAATSSPRQAAPVPTSASSTSTNPSTGGSGGA